ncbi:MAG: bifunctional proline dehydrogenase/L-glutamate gamma-semialdehyde dehydrogenase PutA [Pseudomonadota bacterium]
MIFTDLPVKLSSTRKKIAEAYRVDESACLKALIKQLSISETAKVLIVERAERLVKKVRARQKRQKGLDAILQTYDLSSEEGIALMCVAESLLRIPDSANVDEILSDKLGRIKWSANKSQNDSLFTNAVTWSLMLTGKLYQPPINERVSLQENLWRAIQKGTSPAIRSAVRQMMTFMGNKFVMGKTIEAALKRSKTFEQKGYRYSFDMLGEAAYTQADAETYFQSYCHAIEKVGEQAKGLGPIKAAGISVKLSALHPRYEVAKQARLTRELLPRVKTLMLKAKHYDINLTIDAEEADRLEPSLEIISHLLADPDLAAWDGLGVAVQSYQKRAPFVLDCLAETARKHQHKLMVRLIKGAYWDSEIKVSQELGLKNYPVFTRKNATDVSFLACAQKLLTMTDVIYPQFATHNAHSIATILEWTKGINFEFQCLHGMGQNIYDFIVGKENLDIPCRIYAPVGEHEDLLSYLMRRLLENGANTSFVNLVAQQDIATEKLLQDPIEHIAAVDCQPHPHIPLPCGIYGESRKNAKGLDLSDPLILRALNQHMDKQMKTFPINVAPLINGKEKKSVKSSVIASPCDHKLAVVELAESTIQQVREAMRQAAKAQPRWNAVPVAQRADIILRAAEKLEQDMMEFMTIISLEAGKTINDCVSEVREAIDFCRYYAAEAKKNLAPIVLPGPTGETNTLSMHGRGVIVCISPWNFPLAIFTGQIIAALVTGNAVVAKPAEQTPAIAYAMVKLLHQAGVHTGALQLVLGSGEQLGDSLVNDPRLSGVMFTGSTATARLINLNLAKRDGPILPFIAETGGQNAMIVDSTALPEQVTADVIRSAFGSAGQRCSALRVLYIQDDIADKLIKMLSGAMAELQLGDAWLLETDVGPVIDAPARNHLQQHIERMKNEAKLIYTVDVSHVKDNGFFVGPTMVELRSIKQLPEEVFGPILHVIRYKGQALEKVVADINNTGYGLTFGVHSRIKNRYTELVQQVDAGNAYVNRNIVGAVVGVQPFGGEKLSGTGPKAGGPHYLYRLITERTCTVNTTAVGGNASLLMLSEEEEN